MGCTDQRFTGAVAVIAANVCLRPIGKALNRGTGSADADITYLFRITARTDQEAHMRALLLQSLGGQPLLLKSLKSDDVEHTDKVEVHAIVTSTGRQNLILEQIVSRLSLEPSVIGVSWEIVAEQE
jgi:putative Mg2+ transporter-C (MgtC) family protein